MKTYFYSNGELTVRDGDFVPDGWMCYTDKRSNIEVYMWGDNWFKRWLRKFQSNKLATISNRNL